MRWSYCLSEPLGQTLTSAAEEGKKSIYNVCGTRNLFQHAEDPEAEGTGKRPPLNIKLTKGEQNICVWRLFDQYPDNDPQR